MLGTQVYPPPDVPSKVQSMPQEPSDPLLEFFASQLARIKLQLQHASNGSHASGPKRPDMQGQEAKMVKKVHYQSE